jgi:IS4 transposase
MSVVASSSRARRRRADLSRFIGVCPNAWAKRAAKAERLMPAMDASIWTVNRSEGRSRIACRARASPGSVKAVIHGTGGVPRSIFRRNRNKTQDGRKLRRYRKRWRVERLFAWMHNFRRLVTRWEYHIENFLGFVHLACLYMLLRCL